MLQTPAPQAFLLCVVRLHMRSRQQLCAYSGVLTVCSKDSLYREIYVYIQGIYLYKDIPIYGYPYTGISHIYVLISLYTYICIYMYRGYAEIGRSVFRNVLIQAYPNIGLSLYRGYPYKGISWYRSIPTYGISLYQEIPVYGYPYIGVSLHRDIPVEGISLYWILTSGYAYIGISLCKGIPT